MVAHAYNPRRGQDFIILYSKTLNQKQKFHEGVAGKLLERKG
jgi:hypothetical protein